MQQRTIQKSSIPLIFFSNSFEKKGKIFCDDYSDFHVILIS